MDSKMMLEILSGMLEKMSDKEIESTLKNAKGMLSVEDYEKLKAIIAQRKV